MWFNSLVVPSVKNSRLLQWYRVPRDSSKGTKDSFPSQSLYGCGVIVGLPDLPKEAQSVPVLFVILYSVILSEQK